MKFRSKGWMFLVFWGLFSTAMGQGKVVKPFALRDVSGVTWHLDSQANARGLIVVFTCNHCPFANLYPNRLNLLAEQFASQGVHLIAINSMDSLLYEEEGFSSMQLKATEAGYRFPYLQDSTQLVGKQFGADHTPQAYVIWRDAGKWVVKYSGAIDSNGEDAALAKSFVAAAVEDLLAGQMVEEPVTESFGCRIIYRKK